MTKYEKLMNNLLNTKIAGDKETLANDKAKADNSRYGKAMNYLHRNEYAIDKSRLYSEKHREDRA